MRPRFGFLTRAVATFFAVAGLGAALAALHASGTDVLVLILLAAGFLAVACGLWIDAVPAWWAGLAISAVTVVLDLLVLHDTGWIPWLAILFAFAVSAAQGLRDRARGAIPTPHG